MAIKPSTEELQQFQKEATEIASAMAHAMFDISRDKRVCMVAAMRVAAGAAAMGGIDLHRAIHMFMTFYKEADQRLEEIEK